MLTASSGSNYLWSTGETTQKITAHNSGSYSVTESCVSSSATTVTVNNCNVTLNLRMFISGLYSGNHTMVACIDPINHPTICDSVTIQLADNSTFQVEYETKSVIDINGYGTFVFPAAILNRSFYIVIRHRNSIETWSADPVLFNSSTIQFDFTD